MFVALLLASAAAQGDSLMRDHADCMNRAVFRLEKSGEAAETVAQVALGECRRIISEDRERSLAQRPQNSPISRAQMIDLLDLKQRILEHAAKEQALEDILERRAKRASDQ